MLKAYRDHVAERAALGIPPLPLTAQQVADVIELIKNPPQGEDAFLLDLITHRVPLEEVGEAYHLFSSKLDGCIKPLLVPPGASLH